MKTIQVFLISVLLAGSVGAQTIVGTKHDLSPTGTSPWEGIDQRARVCVYCHTAHNAEPAVPLWNRRGPEAQTFILYSSETLHSVPNQPNGVSKMCLSCHDGVTALNAMFTVTIPMVGGPIGDQLGDVWYPGSPYTDGRLGPNIGGLFPGGPSTIGDLSDDHPISFTYDAALAVSDGELHDPTTSSSGMGSSIANDMLYGPSHDQVECSSCHDIHKDVFSPFLIKTNDGSSLCLTCHVK